MKGFTCIEDKCNFKNDCPIIKHFYERGRAAEREDILTECIHALDNVKATCHEDYVDGIDFSIGVLTDIYEQKMKGGEK